MHIHALGNFAYRLVVIVAVATDVLSIARYAAFADADSQKSPASGAARILRLCLLRQEAGDQGREADGHTNDTQLHDELLCSGVLNSLGGDHRGEARAV